jgi:hypothetical protein
MTMKTTKADVIHTTNMLDTSNTSNIWNPQNPPKMKTTRTRTPYEEVLDGFDGFDTYAKYIENLIRRDEDEENDARFRANLARAIAGSKATAPPTTSVASLAAPNQAIGPAAAGPSMTAARSRSVVLNVLERSAFLTDRPVHDLERLERLKRRRGGREDLHGAERPHPKRPTPFRTTNCAPASQDSPRRKGEVANDPGETEVFWDGELC